MPTPRASGKGCRKDLLPPPLRLLESEAAARYWHWGGSPKWSLHLAPHPFMFPSKRSTESRKHSLTSARSGSCRGKSWELLNICGDRGNTLLTTVLWQHSWTAQIHPLNFFAQEQKPQPTSHVGSQRHLAVVDNPTWPRTTEIWPKVVVEDLGGAEGALGRQGGRKDMDGPAALT